jgi:cold shock protein
MTFLQISKNWLRWRAASLHMYLRKTSYMAQGIVKWFNGQKGYGFIQPNDGGQDVFVHISAVERAGMHGLNEGQKVSFDVAANPKNGKSSAENLRASDLERE